MPNEILTLKGIILGKSLIYGRGTIDCIGELLGLSYQEMVIRLSPDLRLC